MERNVRSDDAVKKQLANRLAKLRQRAAAVAAEIVMLERVLAEIEKQSVGANFRLRKNSLPKLAVHGQIRRILLNANLPVKASDLFHKLKITYPLLNRSTFRSYLKRMEADGSIVRADARGFYSAVNVDIEENDEKFRRNTRARTPLSYL